MSEQPEALRLAKIIEHYNAGVMSQKICEDYLKAAAELRRLHEVNQELLEALKELVEVSAHLNACQGTVEQARAAIAKATGEQA